MGNMENIINILKENSIIVVVGCAILIVIVWLVIRSFKLKKCKKKFNELEVMYNTIKSKPITYKLNQALAIAKLNEDIADMVVNATKDFDLASDNLKLVMNQLSAIDESIDIGKVKQANDAIVETETLLISTEKVVQELIVKLEEVLQQETLLRKKVSKYKDDFRNIKQKFALKKDKVEISFDSIDEIILNIENKFNLFEEWMYASEYNKASAIADEIKDSIVYLQNLDKQLPELLAVAKGVLPKLINDVNYAYEQAKNIGAFVKNLDVEKNVEMIEQNIKSDLLNMSKGNIVGVEDHFLDYKTRLVQLLDQINKEIEATKLVEDAYNRYLLLNKFCYDLFYESSDLYTKVKNRYGFEDLNDVLARVENEINEIAIDEEALKSKIALDVSNSELLITINGLISKTDATKKQLVKLKDTLDNKCDNEIRAINQVNKMYLIIEQIRIRVSKSQLPSISKSYDEDMETSLQLIKQIKRLLAQPTIDIVLLNDLVKEAIDFVYTFFDKVGNIVGVANLTEKIIVFGNRYRCLDNELDTNLTRSEICFKNGEYSNALNIAVNAIEKIYPGIYDLLVKESEYVNE
ncbi:MAG: septation ring formation regulator EzrA [Erysipelotrichaceae bacterium]